MLLFILGIGALVAGYLTYGRYVEKVIGPDDRETPARRKHDGIDFIVMPHWKNMLIQLLNIAGVGPVIGVILGIKFGSIAFLIIPVGNVIAGAVHDFLGGMMSIRHDGANLPCLIKQNLGKPYYRFFSCFMVFLLLLVVAVFINIPANLINMLVPSHNLLWLAILLIFIYYIVATLFPVDKIIGNLYPLFGALLLFGTLAMFLVLIWEGNSNPALLIETAEFKAQHNTDPIIPMLFVTIACGIISGFHATQSPIIARTMASEHHGRQAFYGMMIVEGIIAMIWAAAGLAIYNLFPALMKANAVSVLREIVTYFLGNSVGKITIVSIVILAITSGDTAMRSLRLSLAEMLDIDQKKVRNRVLLCLPLIVVVTGLLIWSNHSAATFTQLWNYFAWGNQVLAASTLLAGTVWLHRQRKNLLIAAVPGAFMLFVVTVYILWISPAHGGPLGFGLSLGASYLIGGIITAVLTAWACIRR